MPLSCPAAASLAAVVASVPLCATCCLPINRGLCERCAPSVLPQLKQPSLSAMMGTALEQTVRPVREQSKDVLKVKRRNARRLERAMRGEFTRSNPRRVA